MFAKLQTNLNDMIKDLTRYLERHKRDIITDDYAFSTYNAPNTMYQVSNDLDSLLLTQSAKAIKLWHMVMLFLKRNSDGTKAIVVVMKYDLFSVGLSRNSFFKAFKELVDCNLLIPTLDSSVYVVNIQYANKLYKPKLDI